MNGSSSSKNGKKKTHHSTMDVTSAEYVVNGYSQTKLPSTISSVGRKPRILYSTRKTFSQRIIHAMNGKVVVI